MSSLPLLSVIIPVYNEEKYLDACLSTLTNQSYPNYEVILVDDGSTDRSLSIARKYPFKILHQPHLGLGPARNLGAKAAKGSILVFPDADMSFDKDFLKYLTGDVIKENTLGTYINNELVANPHNIWSRCWSINANLPPHRRLPENENRTDNAFRAIKRELFFSRGGLDQSGYYTDDISFAQRNRLFSTPAPKAICYHHNPESLAEVFLSTRWMGRSPLFKKNLANFLRYSPPNSLRVSLKYLFRGAPLAIIPFKFVYDFGTLVGIFFSGNKTIK